MQAPPDDGSRKGSTEGPGLRRVGRDLRLSRPSELALFLTRARHGIGQARPGLSDRLAEQIALGRGAAALEVGARRERSRAEGPRASRERGDTPPRRDREARGLHVKRAFLPCFIHRVDMQHTDLDDDSVSRKRETTRLLLKEILENTHVE